MTCERCGGGANGQFCAGCADMDRVERNHEHRHDDDGSRWDDGDGDDEPGHAGSVAAQLRQAARDGDLPAEFADRVPGVDGDE